MRIQLLLALVSLSSCAQLSPDAAFKPQTLTRKDLTALPLTLAAWQKITKPGSVNVYIEGDGRAWLSRTTPSGNPTPHNPLGLRLADVDPAANVVYLARPCQYVDINTAHPCPSAYWTDKRYAPDVIVAYDRALDTLRGTYGLTGFHLIGFSGGANIAGLLAERRSDILSLRSVAGNLDNEAFTRLHAVSPMPQSLNMATDAAKLSGLPQRHFIGGRDAFVPSSIFESYRSAVGPSVCLNVTYNKEAGHLDDLWVERWPAYLKLSTGCQR